MKYLHLVWAALMRRKTRTVFTLLSVLAAFLLFGMLDAVRTAFVTAGDSVAGIDRVVTTSKISLVVELPASLRSRIAATSGVSKLTYANWFGGYYKDPKDFFANMAVGEDFFAVYSEYLMPAEQVEAFKRTRMGAVAGERLAKKYGWKIGDRIPLKATIFPNRDGSNDWAFDLVGIYRLENPKLKGQEDQLFFNWAYFDESRQFGNGNIGWFVARVSDPAQSDRVVKAIDALSRDSAHETKTQSEQAFQAGFVSQFANIGLIVGAIMTAVFFTLVLLTGNTMAQAVRERIPELAVLKTIGFSNRSVLGLVLAESVMLIVIGGVLGMALSVGVVEVLQMALAGKVPLVPVGAEIWARALVLMVGIGLVIGVLPALRGMRLRIVDALAGR